MTTAWTVAVVASVSVPVQGADRKMAEELVSQAEHSFVPHLSVIDPKLRPAVSVPAIQTQGGRNSVGL